MHTLTLRQARRLAVAAQGLAGPRIADVVSVARRVGAIQVDATSYTAPSAELVLLARMGDALAPGDLADARETRELVEYRGFLRPAADLALYYAEMASWPGVHPAAWQAAMARWVDDNDHAREQILQALRSDGPLPARELPDEFVRPWRSSGWNNNKNVPMMLERLEERGEVAVSHREGRDRVWDLAERIYPDLPAVPLEEAARQRDALRLTALGIARAKGPACATEPHDVGEAGEAAVIEGVRGRWRVAPAALDERAEPRVALLSPLDRLVADRKRMADLFDFDYALEMYKPAAQRRWGYYALPVLDGERLVGKVDAEADHAGGYLRVHAVHDDEPWPKRLHARVEDELATLAGYLGLEVDPG